MELQFTFKALGAHVSISLFFIDLTRQNNDSEVCLLIPKVELGHHQTLGLKLCSIDCIVSPLF